MRHVKICMLVCTCLCMQLSHGEYTISCTPSEFSFYVENGFDRVRAPKYHLTGIPGSPELPALYLNYIIPPNAKVESLIILESKIIDIPGEYYVYPAQPSVAFGETTAWVPPEASIYNSTMPYPGEFIRVTYDGVMDGARIVTIEFFPLQYRPSSQELLLIQDIRFEFAYNNSSLPALCPQIRGIFEQSSYDAALKAIVVNDHEIPMRYQRPTLVKENQLLAPPPHPELFAPAVIITPSVFFGTFQPYADWLIDQGIPTKLVSPQTIYQYWTGVDCAEKLRNYIIECYNHGGTYFLLGGDDYFVPIRYGSPVGPHATPNDSIPCDQYFSDLTGNWNADGDLFWGEIEGDSADRYPEVFVGRITACTSDEVSNWVTKALHYEKTPDIIFDSILWIRASNLPGYDDIPEIFPAHINHRIADDYDADDVLDLIDRGYGFLNIVCHGSIEYALIAYPGYKLRRWWHRKNESDAGVNWLTNHNKYFVGYAISCHLGSFDSLGYCPGQSATDTCFADAFVDAYRYNYYGNAGLYGSCAFLANTRTGAEPSLYLRDEFWNLIMNPWDSWLDEHVTEIGIAEAVSKCSPKINWNERFHRHVCYAHNLFGAPQFESWTKTPLNLNASHLQSIPADDTTYFTVTVTDSLTSSPLRHAKVCLNKPNDIYEVEHTGSDGQVTFIVVPKSAGIIKVTVTRPHDIDNNYNQYLPSQTTCRVLDYPSGPQSRVQGEVMPDKLGITRISTVIANTIALQFEVPVNGDATIALYDILGSRIWTIRRRALQPGCYEEKINVSENANGVYFVVVSQDNKNISTKLLIVR